MKTNLTTTDFINLSRCEAICLARELNEMFTKDIAEAYSKGFKESLEQAYKNINNELKQKRLPITFSYTIEETNNED